MPGLNILGQGILQSCSGHPRVALTFLTAHDLLYSPGVIWAGKTPYIIELSVRSQWLCKLPLVRRPESFCKTSFLAMLEFFYDRKRFTKPISDAVLTSSLFFAPQAHKIDLHGDLVLTFDLAATRVTDFETSLVEHVNTVLKQFLSKYQQELQIATEDFSYIYKDGIFSLAAVLDLVACSQRWRVFVCIRNAPSLAAGDTAEIKKSLELFFICPLSGYLHDFNSGLAMETGDEPDPRISTYHLNHNGWKSTAIDLAD
ncbi:hypothetical protein DFS33DRAFT_1387465 [Desarmillaria ectypa]|nr:hypothetical protein DFS33DRAFT_1387465 [Desarmillaria ectypa]